MDYQWGNQENTILVYIDDFGNYIPFYIDKVEWPLGDYELWVSLGGTPTAYVPESHSEKVAAEFDRKYLADRECEEYELNYMNRYYHEFTLGRYHDDYEIPVLLRMHLYRTHELLEDFKNELELHPTEDVKNSTIDFDNLTYTI